MCGKVWYSKPARASALGVMAVVIGCHGTGRSAPGGLEPQKLRDVDIVWDFEADEVGTLPGTWRIGQTNPTEALARWEIVRDPTAPSQPHVLALTRTRNYNGTYNLAIAENTSFEDIDLTVKVKAVSGEEDQGGGPIWRCKDENNYYICRFNPLEGNYRVYKVVNGRRKQLDSVKVETQADRWYAIRITMVNDRIVCYLDRKKLLHANDDAIRGAGHVGLWTKADAVTSFDDLTVRPMQDK